MGVIVLPQRYAAVKRLNLLGLANYLGNCGSDLKENFEFKKGWFLFSVFSWYILWLQVNRSCWLFKRIIFSGTSKQSPFFAKLFSNFSNKTWSQWKKVVRWPAATLSIRTTRRDAKSTSKTGRRVKKPSSMETSLSSVSFPLTPASGESITPFSSSYCLTQGHKASYFIGDLCLKFLFPFISHGTFGDGCYSVLKLVFIYNIHGTERFVQEAVNTSIVSCLHCNMTS